MNKKVILTGATLMSILALTTAPVFAETGKDTSQIEKLDGRVRNLEERMAKVEAATHKQMGMMQHGHDMMDKGMKQGQDMMDKGMQQGQDMMDKGMNNHPMGQAPQQGMPQGGAPQQPAGGMPAGGMGDM